MIFFRDTKFPFLKKLGNVKVRFVIRQPKITKNINRRWNDGEKPVELPLSQGELRSRNLLLLSERDSKCVGWSLKGEIKMNQTTIAGHLGADPEVRFTSSGKKVTTLRVAARVRKGGKDETIWWRVSVWGEEFDKMIPYFKKGSPIVVVGEMNKPEIFTDRDGKPQVSMSLTALNIMFSPFGKPESGGAESRDHHEPSQEYAGAMSGSSKEMGSFAEGQGKRRDTFDDDEVPF